MGSYTWKSDWGPGYHQSMAISLAALVFSSLLSLRAYQDRPQLLFRVLNNALVIRQILVRKNKKLDADENLVMKGVNRTRVEDAAKLEGISFEQAMERRKGYRYLY